MNRKLLILMVCCAIALGSCGCDSIRKAPSESLKQTAQIQTDMADQVYVKGCSPASETATMLKESAEATQLYIGLAKTMPEDRFATIAAAKDSATATTLRPPARSISWATPGAVDQVACVRPEQPRR